MTDDRNDGDGKPATAIDPVRWLFDNRPPPIMNRADAFPIPHDAQGGTMNNQSPSSCCSHVSSIGGITGADFGALDQLAVRLISLDDSFDAPLWEMGQVIGQRIARDRAEKPLPLEEALSTLISACGLEGVIDSRFVRRDSEEALLQITGCAEVLGEIPNVGRAVCGFDAGLFAGFLRGVTEEKALSVEEVTCLGLGDACCEFHIRRRD